ncbi:MAG: hypothetical protein ABL901_02950 [Hyphomicrobiaceae bacterium]|nr:hypothetical protein [Hyphomicrobiaceae bacterium]
MAGLTKRQRAGKQAARTRSANNFEARAHNASFIKAAKIAKKEGHTYADGKGRYGYSAKATYKLGKSQERASSRVEMIKRGVTVKKLAGGGVKLTRARSSKSKNSTSNS